MKITFKIEELEDGINVIHATFEQNGEEPKKLKSTSKKEFDDAWKKELILCFVEEKQLEDVEVEVIL